MKQARRTLSSPIHILVVTPVFFPRDGGKQRYIEELYASILRLHKNVRVTVLTYNTDHSPEREIYKNMVIYRIPCVRISQGFFLPNILSLASRLFKLSTKHFDYVHTHIRMMDAAWWAWAYARIIGAKSIITIHEATHPTHRSRAVQWLMAAFDRTIATMCIDAYDLVTVTNTPAKNFTANELGIRSPQFISYGGVDTLFFSPRKNAVKALPRVYKHFPKGSVVITFAGRLVWSKGVTYLFKAIQSMKPIPKNVYFVFAGGGDQTNWLRNAIMTNHLEHKVIMTGPLTREEMKQLLRVTDIFIHPSHQEEGFPSVLLEALSSECFCIATANEGTSEIVLHNKTGLLIPEKNAAAIKKSIQWALSHRKERLKIAREGRQYMKMHFEWKTVAQSFFVLMREQCQFNRAGNLLVYSEANA